LKARITKDEVMAGEALATRWSAKHADPMANDFRAAGQAWRQTGRNVAARN
jgi:hypothetical protein